MPTGKENRIHYLPRGSASFDAVDEAQPAYRPSDLGTKQFLDGVERLKVAVDSGATSATPGGVPLAGDIAYWKDSRDSVKIVTNDLRFSEDFENSMAGVFTNAPTPGNLTYIRSGRTKNVSVQAVGTSFAQGDIAISDTLANNSAGAARIAKGATMTAYQRLGTARGAASGGFVYIDLELPDYD